MINFEKGKFYHIEFDKRIWGVLEELVRYEGDSNSASFHPHQRFTTLHRFTTLASKPSQMGQEEWVLGEVDLAPLPIKEVSLKDFPLYINYPVINPLFKKLLNGEVLSSDKSPFKR